MAMEEVVGDRRGGCGCRQVPVSGGRPTPSIQVGQFNAGTVGKAVMGPIGLAASLAMIYHGYKRNDSILWGLAWGLTGLLGVPFALAQGFGEPKRRKNPSRLRRYR